MSHVCYLTNTLLKSLDGYHVDIYQNAQFFAKKTNNISYRDSSETQQLISGIWRILFKVTSHPFPNAGRWRIRRLALLIAEKLQRGQNVHADGLIAPQRISMADTLFEQFHYNIASDHRTCLTSAIGSDTSWRELACSNLHLPKPSHSFKVFPSIPSHSYPLQWRLCQT